jgi:hypothetical protein
MGGKRKGKMKFRNSEEARSIRELQSDWHELQKKWGVEQEQKKRKRLMAAGCGLFTSIVGRTNTHHIKSSRYRHYLGFDKLFKNTQEQRFLVSVLCTKVMLFALVMKKLKISAHMCFATKGV